MSYYGEAPVDLGPLELPEWQEFMHYLYLPVRIPEQEARGGKIVTLPQRLRFMHPIVYRAMRDATETCHHLDDPYVYLTMRRGFATPGNPLNRPGWHCDDFGGTDLNYIWSDNYPTRWLGSENEMPLAIRPSDDESMKDMADYAAEAEKGWKYLLLSDMPVNRLMRLSPYVIHDTPIIPEPGGMRSFFKISVSTHRYDLIGNSHNYLLNYDWPMQDRVAVRNQPNGNKDYSPITQYPEDASFDGEDGDDGYPGGDRGRLQELGYEGDY